MARAARVLAAVIAGAGVWAVLWLIGTRGAQAAWPNLVIPDQPLVHTGILLSYIGYSVVLSILAGFVAAAAAGSRPMLPVWILAGLQLTLGVLAEVSYWSLMPVWYHVVFLALIAPATVYGGWLRARWGSAVVSSPLS
jgi:hypothetical protein